MIERPSDPAPGQQRVEVLVLGPAAVVAGGRTVPAGPPHRRAVLARLAVSEGAAVSREGLVEAVWGATPPPDPAASLQTHVWALRRLLGEQRIVRAGNGYRLELPRDACDAWTVQDALARAQAALAGGDRPAREAAAEVLEEALGRWRGTPLTEVQGAAGEAGRERLAQLRLDVIVCWAQLLIGTGDPVRVLDVLRQGTQEHPLDERLSRLLMTTLRDLGRRAEALQEFERLRAALRAELSLLPGALTQQLHQELLGGSAPEPDAGPAGATQLPDEPAGFVGRDDELQRIAGWLRPAEGPAAPTLVLIDGAGGLGKSALALRAAHAAAAHFPDGQLYAALHAHHADLAKGVEDVLPEFLQALGAAPDGIPAGVEAQSGLLRSMLAGRRYLIVLDDVPSADVVRALLPATAGCAVLITSRLRLQSLSLGEGVRRVTLGPLSPDDALALLLPYVGRGGLVDRASARALAAACDHWPLALRVAAELVSEQPGGPVPDGPGGALVRMGEGIGDGDGIGDGIGQGIGRAVGEVLSWSYERLPDDLSRRLYRLLGVCPTVTFDLHTVGALLGVPPVQAGQAVRTLVGRHLLEPVPAQAGRFGMHDLVRMHAHAECLHTERPPERDDAVARVLTWYGAAVVAARLARGLPPLHPSAGRVDSASAGQALALTTAGAADAWFVDNRDNLLLAARTAATVDHPAAWQIPLGLLAYFFEHHDPQAQIASHEAGMAAARRAGALELQAGLLNNLASLYLRVGDLEHTIELVRRSLEIMTASGDRGWFLQTSANLAWMCLRTDRLEEAEAVARRALETTTPGEWQAAGATMVMAELHYRRGEADEGWARAQLALTQAAASETEHILYSITLDVARTVMGHRPQEAVTLLRGLLAKGTVHGSLDLAHIWTELARATRRTGDPAGAGEAARRALALFAEAGATDAQEATLAEEVLREVGGAG